MSEVKVSELDELLQKMADKEKEIDALTEVLTNHNKEFTQLKFRAVAFLQELDRDNYSAPAGKIEMKDQWRVNLPKTDQDKMLFFDFLKEQGIFEKMATVNSNSLNSLYRSYWEDAKAKGEGMTFGLPGIGAPIIDRIPKFKASK